MTTSPALPPGLVDLNSVPRHEFLNQMERHPLFMHSLSDDTSDNDELEALKALAFEGTPEEVALNFKSQGNDAFRERRFRDALEFYSKGVAAQSGDTEVHVALLLNRAATNLELRRSPAGRG
jgi:tetratricopeptide repeat protein 4